MLVLLECLSSISKHHKKEASSLDTRVTCVCVFLLFVSVVHFLNCLLSSILCEVAYDQRGRVILIFHSRKTSRFQVPSSLRYLFSRVDFFLFNGRPLKQTGT